MAATLADSSAHGKVMVASITTNDEQRDAHLRSPDFFDVEEHPEMTFQSTRIVAIDEESSQLFGDLTMHGVTLIPFTSAASNSSRCSAARVSTDQGGAAKCGTRSRSRRRCGKRHAHAGRLRRHRGAGEAAGQVAMLPSMLGAMLMRGEKYSGVPGRGAHLLEGPA